MWAKSLSPLNFLKLHPPKPDVSKAVTADVECPKATCFKVARPFFKSRRPSQLPVTQTCQREIHLQIMVRKQTAREKKSHSQSQEDMPSLLRQHHALSFKRGFSFVGRRLTRRAAAGLDTLPTCLFREAQKPQTPNSEHNLTAPGFALASSERPCFHCKSLAHGS